MLWNSSAIIGYSLHATDGHIGTVNDILFEDAHWSVRWLVVDTGTWLPGRKVLIPVSELSAPDRALRSFPVKLTKDQIKNSPDSDTHKPVSRQHEVNIYEFYGLDPYWGGGLYPLSNAMAVPFIMPPPPTLSPKTEALPAPVALESDQHLRSVEAVIGYHIHATDGEIGHAADFLIDDETWEIRYVKADTRNWWPGQRVLISPDLVTSISWLERLVHVNVDKAKVKESPPYHDEMTVDGAYDERLRDYYGSAYLGIM